MTHYQHEAPQPALGCRVCGGRSATFGMGQYLLNATAGEANGNKDLTVTNGGLGGEPDKRQRPRYV
ncbi:MAG: hypothetical protein LBD01_04190 [Puniceicoccales bacterium]|jgi:hypothetical protein|nr:hypothetical protein [Puniceicoccales bacterium]